MPDSSTFGLCGLAVTFLQGSQLSAIWGYWLEDGDLCGHATMHGPVGVRMP
jgi:hypothetical protein